MTQVRAQRAGVTSFCAVPCNTAIRKFPIRRPFTPLTEVLDGRFGSVAAARLPSQWHCLKVASIR